MFKKLRSRYTAELCYGKLYCGDEGETYHAFELTDETDNIDGMEEYLAKQLDVSADDENFDWDVMEVALPQTTVERIQYDLVRKMLEKGVLKFTPNIFMQDEISGHMSVDSERIVSVTDTDAWTANPAQATAEAICAMLKESFDD